MTPRLQVGNLECQAFRVLKRLLDRVLQKATTAVAAAKEEPDLLYASSPGPSRPARSRGPRLTL